MDSMNQDRLVVENVEMIQPLNRTHAMVFTGMQDIILVFGDMNVDPTIRRSDSICNVQAAKIAERERCMCSDSTFN